MLVAHGAVEPALRHLVAGGREMHIAELLLGRLLGARWGSYLRGGGGRERDDGGSRKRGLVRDLDHGALRGECWAAERQASIFPAPAARAI
jgi:hypothetical protein